MTITESIDAMPVGMPERPDEAIIMAKVVAYNAFTRAGRYAEMADGRYFECLRQLDILASVGMLDRTWLDDITAELLGKFNAAVAALSQTHRRAA
jgi:hypothetical protein